jgi:hypothetical protein
MSMEFYNRWHIKDLANNLISNHISIVNKN